VKTNGKRPLTEQEKQILPMPGEVDPKDAFIQGHIAVAKAISRLKLDTDIKVAQQS
jgi:hypothetical protein